MYQTKEKKISIKKTIIKEMNSILKIMNEKKDFKDIICRN